MNKFKVGDKVALVTSPHDYLGCIASIGEDGVALVEFPPRYIHAFIVKLDQIVPYDETDMPDDEIYAMLKPKLDKAVFNGRIKYSLSTLISFNDVREVNCYQEDDAIKAIALAYRSGYLRAKKGRPFKIGGDKE